MKDAIEIIRSEHRNLDKVLGVLSDLLDRLDNAGPKPNLEPLFSIVYYVRVFPDKLHHPKEEKFLFPLLRRHRPDLSPVIEELERQHELGRESLESLQKALQDFDRDYPKGFDELLSTGKSFVRSQREHMGIEEREILPAAKEWLAENRLENAEWTPLQRAFEHNSDPLFGENVEAGFRTLFERITR
jgi:branched-chain amino acid transport system ATP-binding protein